MLTLGIIGFGRQAWDIVRTLRETGERFEIAAVIDPRGIYQESPVEEAKDARVYETIDAMFAKERLCGVIIASPDMEHAAAAVACARYDLPVFLEKPVAVDFDQLEALARAFKNKEKRVVVSLPMRLCPLTETVLDIVASGRVGTIEHVNAFNDVTYGGGYFSSRYRDPARFSGMFLQKAVHDLDYIMAMVGSRPRTVCAMKARRVLKGDKPFDLSCDRCDDRATCPESPENFYLERYAGKSLAEIRESRKALQCPLSADIRNEDIGQCVVEFENGAQATYVQNFFVRKGHRRGGRLYGSKGIIDYDFKGSIDVAVWRGKYDEHIEVVKPNSTHYGGDRELVLDFVRLMKTGEAPRSNLENGLIATRLALYAKRSAEEKAFFDIR